MKHQRLKNGGIMKNKISVVIIGGLHHNTLGVLRSLGESNIDKSHIQILLVDENPKRNNIISASKYVDKKNISYIKHNEQVKEWLIKNANSSIKKVLICCSDGSAEVVISNAEELQKWYYTPDIKVDISDFMCKQTQCNYAISCGLNVPYSSIKKADEVCDWNLFPCITKPIKSVAGAGKGDIKILSSKNELDDYLKHTKSEFVQIQEFINKKMEFQLIGCSLNAGEIIIIPGYTDIIRQPPNTNTGYLKYSPIKDFRYNDKIIENFIRGIGYSGLFSIEFIRDREDKDYFLEINLRNDGNAYCVQSAGINLPYIWCYYQVTQELPDCRLTFDRPVWFMPDLFDVKRGIQSVGFWKWIHEFFAAKSHAVYSPKDLKPIIQQMYELITWVVKSKIKR